MGNVQQDNRQNPEHGPRGLSMTNDKDHYHYKYYCAICHGVHEIGEGCEAKVNSIDKNTREIRKSLEGDTK